jgi:hypothetical protein
MYREPKRDVGKVLTEPSDGVSNNGRDNSNHDYIFHVGDIITSGTAAGNIRAPEFVVEAALGSGSFG